LAAAADPILSAEVVRAIAQEGRALGFNWSFTPAVDISAHIASAIVGTRSYGSHLDTIVEQAIAHVRAMQAQGLAATAKHWPGEGHDPRDQHLVTTINPLSMDDWQRSFGHIYRAIIDAGVMTVMSAHIALPAWARLRAPNAGLEACMPASLSSALNLGLLRGELGFNGVIVSDATLMAGLGSWADRATLVPQVIESGCDVFLFSRHEEQDIAHMAQGLRDGRLSEQRLEDAVTRILGLKAALGLHRKTIDERLPPLEAARAMIGAPSHQAAAQRAAAQSITLIKDVRSTLPLALAKHRRVVVIGESARSQVPGIKDNTVAPMLEGLRARGFDVRDYDPANPPTPADTDLVLYLLTQESMLTVSRIYIDWRALQPGLLSTMERYWHDLPTVMVSFGHPYHLFDAPRVPTYINAYSAIEPVQRALVRKLLGDEPFTGSSPVDAFCGLPDARH
jgi:beta-N-acetylhexosaminidase